MEKIGALERENIMNVLSEGRELASELKRKLGSREDCDILVENILCSYENAIKLIGDPSKVGVGEAFEISKGSHLNSKDHKKRKTKAKWSERVTVRSEEDGYNWRKYGQKGILGSTYPRSYYRCTHRHTQGCLATKQVQRSDNDPLLFEVVYRGNHSCLQQRHNNLKKECASISPHLEPKLDNQQGLTKDVHFPSFSFHTTPIESESQFLSVTGNFMGTNYSPPFLSPATSESYFSVTQCLGNEFGSDFCEIMSNPTPITNFSFGDLDFSIDQIDFS